jgi:hypothetical protein
MGYNMRVYALSEGSLSVPQIQKRLGEEELPVTIEVHSGEESCWAAITLAHEENRTPIALVEKEMVSPGSLASQEITELLSQLDQTKPSSVARYLRGFLQKVKVIYIFQVLSGADRDKGWDALYAVQDQLIENLGGILHADLEGFSIEDRYQITWEFSSKAVGEWTMAVLDGNDHWIAFRMDLGNKEHRKAFCAGRIPPDLKTWDIGSARIS